MCSINSFSISYSGPSKFLKIYPNEKELKMSPIIALPFSSFSFENILVNHFER